MFLHYWKLLDLSVTRGGVGCLWVDGRDGEKNGVEEFISKEVKSDVKIYFPLLTILPRARLTN